MICRLVFVFLCSIPMAAFAQDDIPCEEDPLYQYLDFWLGEWQVFNENGMLIGENRIDRILEGCAVVEHWTGAEGGQGKGFFYVDNASKNWKQIWVTEDAKSPWGQKEKTLLFHQKGRVVFQGAYTFKKTRVLDRTILEQITASEVHQTIEVSYDGGLTWEQSFLGVYKRK